MMHAMNSPERNMYNISTLKGGKLSICGFFSMLDNTRIEFNKRQQLCLKMCIFADKVHYIKVIT